MPISSSKVAYVTYSVEILWCQRDFDQSINKLLYRIFHEAGLTGAEVGGKEGWRDRGTEGQREAVLLAHPPPSPDSKVGRVKERRRHLVPRNLVSESEANRRVWS